MKAGNLDNILHVLQYMAQLELALAEFYEACAQTWEEDEDFWSRLGQQERQHAQNIRKMAEIISEKYEFFESFRPFNPAAVRTIISGIEDNRHRLKGGGISKRNALFIARDIERSLIEAKYSEIVKTTDIEYKNLLTAIITQTEAHENLIDKRIQEAKAPA